MSGSALINFGATTGMLNQQSTPLNVLLKSSGGVDLSISNISITGTNASNFTQTNTCGTLPASLGVQSTCTSSVVFTPTTYGKFTASLTFTDNGPNSPQKVMLNGAGPDFSMVSSVNQITITRGSSKTATLTLSPIAGFNQTVTLLCSGAPAGTTCTPNPTSVTLDGVNNGTSVLTITVGSSTVPGTYTLTAFGRFSPLQHPATITLTVQ